MTDSLFDLPRQQQSQAEDVGPARVMEWQVEKIRELFGAAEIRDQAARRTLVESVVGTSVDSLRALTRYQALLVIEELSGRRSREHNPKRSAWDDREEDTWIDRL